MKYKLMPENSERDITNEDAKSKSLFDKNNSATIKAIANPDIAASGNEYGICFLSINIPSLFANVSFLIKVVLEKCLTIIGTPTIVAQKKNEDQYEKVFCLLLISEITNATAKPKLIPNQNTKFHNLSLVRHLACTVGVLFTATSGFVKSCITRSYIWFKPYIIIIPKIDVIAKRFIAIVGVISILLLHNAAQAATTTNSKDSILKLITIAETKHCIPSGLLLAVIKTESNLNPLALNINGKAFFFDDKDSALSAINKAITSGIVSINIGLAQINYKWHGENFTSVESMLSAELNIGYAARLLSKLKITHRDWHKAVRHYHSANSTYNQKYSRKVVAC